MTLTAARKFIVLWRVHMVTRVLNEDGVCKLKFFKMATDDELFYQHWYRHESGLEVCNHPVLPLSFNQGNTCTMCRTSDLGTDDCLRCNV